MEAINVSQGIKPRSVPSGRGVDWISGGFELFKRAPGIWIGMIVIWILLIGTVSYAPGGGLVTGLFGPVFQAGWFIGCKSLDDGAELKIEHLFSGFSGGKIGQLLLVGVLYFVGFVLIAVLAGGLIFAGGASFLHGGEGFQFGMSTLLGLLIGLVLLVPLMMANWFAPALVVFHDVPAIEAMKLSFAGSWQNMAPFTLYGLIAVLIAIVAAIPLMLGFLIVGPVLIASSYMSYKDIFSVQSPDVGETTPG
ncbi:MAG: BPSS1780 family membrane protein [Stenotrophobium sp.]